MPIVRIPSPTEDAIPWRGALAAALLGLSLGLGLAWATIARPSPDAATELDPARDARATTSEARGDEAPSASITEPSLAARDDDARDDDARDDDARDDDARDDDARDDDGAASADEPSRDAAPIDAPTPTPRSPSSRVILREGRVAYLRCEGVPQRPGPFPCPRDPGLEEAVWSALRGVERCDDAPRSGQADVVLSVDPPEPIAVRTRDTFRADVERADGDALLRCTREALAQVRPTLGFRRLMVSFRLTLEGAR